jgi:hypothetical protein
VKKARKKRRFLHLHFNKYLLVNLCEKKEPLDREMGDTELSDIVDEKAWDSNEENDDKDEGEEKISKDRDRKLEGCTLDEMRTRSDDDHDEKGDITRI